VERIIKSNWVAFQEISDGIKAVEKDFRKGSITGQQRRDLIIDIWTRGSEAASEDFTNSTQDRRETGRQVAEVPSRPAGRGKQISKTRSS